MQIDDGIMQKNLTARLHLLIRNISYQSVGSQMEIFFYQERLKPEEKIKITKMA